MSDEITIIVRVDLLIPPVGAGARGGG